MRPSKPLGHLSMAYDLAKNVWSQIPSNPVSGCTMGPPPTIRPEISTCSAAMRPAPTTGPRSAWYPGRTQGPGYSDLGQASNGRRWTADGRCRAGALAGGSRSARRSMSNGGAAKDSRTGASMPTALYGGGPRVELLATMQGARHRGPIPGRRAAPDESPPRNQSHSLARGRRRQDLFHRRGAVSGSCFSAGWSGECLDERGIRPSPTIPGRWRAPGCRPGALGATRQLRSKKRAPDPRGWAGGGGWIDRTSAASFSAHEVLWTPRGKYLGGRAPARMIHAASRASRAGAIGGKPINRRFPGSTMPGGPPGTPFGSGPPSMKNLRALSAASTNTKSQKTMSKLQTLSVAIGKTTIAPAPLFDGSVADRPGVRSCLHDAARSPEEESSSAAFRGPRDFDICEACPMSRSFTVKTLRERAICPYVGGARLFVSRAFPPQLESMCANRPHFKSTSRFFKGQSGSAPAGISAEPPCVLGPHHPGG